MATRKGGHAGGRGAPKWARGEGRGRGGGGDWIALAGWKASPLSGPSLSWGVSKEGPRRHGWPIVWLAGDETPPNQNQNGTEWEGGGGGGTRQKHKKTPRSCLQGKALAPGSKHEHLRRPRPRAFLTPLTSGNRSGFCICGGFFFLLFCTKIN